MKRKVKRKAVNRSANRKLSRQAQYESPIWKAKREEIFKRDNYKCQDKNCNGLSNELHCHHRKYFKGYLWDTPEEFLITLCAHCHSKAHGRFLGRKVVKRK